MKRLSFSVVSFGLAASLVVALAPGCTTHGEGGRCDPKNINQSTNLNADCDSDLQCTNGAILSLPEGGTVEGWICCPVDRSKSTTDICKGSPVSPGSDASITDATTDQSTADVTTDVTTDVANDVVTTDASDASSDAPDAD